MATKAMEAEETALVHQVATPMEMLAVAVGRGAGIDELGKLMDLQERWEKNEARKAFVSAMSAFKATPPRMEKVKHVNFQSKSGSSTVDYHYAPLDYVSQILDRALSVHGLSFRWNVQQLDTPLPVHVTCILQHNQGHSESVSLCAAIHDDQRMNPIQRLGATVSYLQRYTLLSATGMATEGMDTDANGATNGELAEQIEWLQNASSKDELKRLFEAAYTKFEANPAALRALVAAKNEKRKEF